MQTHLSAGIANTAPGQEANDILRSCVHCGFCNATCPTYQLLGDELDGPRGRIYLIKQALEGATISNKTSLHLDRCLSCRACETTCPSGVRYGRLLDIGREYVEKQQLRPWTQRMLRRLLASVLPYPNRFALLFGVGRGLRRVLPAGLGRRFDPPSSPQLSWPSPRHQRRMLILEGCVQPVMAPHINVVAAQIFDRLGISLIRAQGEGCCGAVNHHLSDSERALQLMRRNIDAWWPHVEDGVEAVIITASGCATMVKEYGQLLAHDSDYALKATRIASLTRDVSEVLRQQDLSSLTPSTPMTQPIAFHPPCSLQHGQKLAGVVEEILGACGFTLTSVPDAHLCCGAAGTYSILQSELSRQLLEKKIAALEQARPALIVSANLACQAQLQTMAKVPVRHWLELLM